LQALPAFAQLEHCGYALSHYPSRMSGRSETRAFDFPTFCFLLLHLSQAVRCLFRGLLASSVLGEMVFSVVMKFKVVIVWARRFGTAGQMVLPWEQQETGSYAYLSYWDVSARATLGTVCYLCLLGKEATRRLIRLRATLARSVGVLQNVNFWPARVSNILIQLEVRHTT